MRRRPPAQVGGVAGDVDTVGGGGVSQNTVLGELTRVGPQGVRDICGEI